MTIFLNEAQYQWHSDSVNTARVHLPELYNTQAVKSQIDSFGKFKFSAQQRTRSY